MGSLRRVGPNERMRKVPAKYTPTARPPQPRARGGNISAIVSVAILMCAVAYTYPPERPRRYAGVGMPCCGARLLRNGYASGPVTAAVRRWHPRSLGGFAGPWPDHVVARGLHWGVATMRIYHQPKTLAPMTADQILTAARASSPGRSSGTCMYGRVIVTYDRVAMTYDVGTSAMSLGGGKRAAALRVVHAILDGGAVTAEQVAAYTAATTPR